MTSKKAGFGKPALQLFQIVVVSELGHDLPTVNIIKVIAMFAKEIKAELFLLVAKTRGLKFKEAQNLASELRLMHLASLEKLEQRFEAWRPRPN